MYTLADRLERVLFEDLDGEHLDNDDPIREPSRPSLPARSLGKEFRFNPRQMDQIPDAEDELPEDSSFSGSNTYLANAVDTEIDEPEPEQFSEFDDFGDDEHFGDYLNRMETLGADYDPSAYLQGLKEDIDDDEPVKRSTQGGSGVLRGTKRRRVDQPLSLDLTGDLPDPRSRRPDDIASDWEEGDDEDDLFDDEDQLMSPGERDDDSDYDGLGDYGGYTDVEDDTFRAGHDADPALDALYGAGSDEEQRQGPKKGDFGGARLNKKTGRPIKADLKDARRVRFPSLPPWDSMSDPTGIPNSPLPVARQKPERSWKNYRGAQHHMESLERKLAKL